MLFSDKNIDPAQYNPLVLAYIGDTVYDLFIRTRLLESGFRNVTHMHKEAVGYVRAHSQAVSAHMIEPLLTEEELSVFKRGRNAKSNTSPKNADIIDYRTATGLEALIGYLYLENETDRLDVLLNVAAEAVENQA